jgi:hypothetical protein
VLKRPGCEADHSLPSTDEVKNLSSCTSTPPYIFMMWCLIKHSDNFIICIRLFSFFPPTGCVGGFYARTEEISSDWFWWWVMCFVF